MSGRILALALVLGAAVVLLCVVVVYLLRREASPWRGPRDTTADRVSVRDSKQAGDVSSQEPSEFERIRQIDATVDGRLPQQTVVERTDWSEAKVSRVVSRLTEEGHIEKVRVGRRNLIEVCDDSDADRPEEPT